MAEQRAVVFLWQAQMPDTRLGPGEGEGGGEGGGDRGGETDQVLVTTRDGHAVPHTTHKHMYHSATSTKINTSAILCSAACISFADEIKPKRAVLG